jgi:hypothetical protein
LKKKRNYFSLDYFSLIFHFGFTYSHKAMHNAYMAATCTEQITDTTARVSACSATMSDVATNGCLTQEVGVWTI